jgi:hypothetical protein
MRTQISEPTGTWTVVASFGHGVEVTHHDWRTDHEAVRTPWAVMVNGVLAARHISVNAAGSHARAVAERRAVRP